VIPEHIRRDTGCPSFTSNPVLGNNMNHSVERLLDSVRIERLFVMRERADFVAEILRLLPFSSAYLNFA